MTLLWHFFLPSRISVYAKVPLIIGFHLVPVAHLFVITLLNRPVDDLLLDHLDNIQAAIGDSLLDLLLVLLNSLFLCFELAESHQRL